VGLTIGSIAVDPPVVLAPMAGVTNAAFRRLCRRYGDGIFVSEMTSARGLVERSPKSRAMVVFTDGGTRSVQLYGVDPETVAGATKIVVDELGADHVDLNFGCPVPKVTRRGGGSAVPAHPALFGAIVAASVQAAGDAPVTVKMRLGIDDERITAFEAARRAEDAGVAAITLHARTAEQHYSGSARWDAIAALKDQVRSVPVLGNGDVWQAEDAVRMMRETGCDGVVIGRGCLGRPWFFGELHAALTGRPLPAPPSIGEVCDVVLEHATALVELDGERMALLAMRKHVGWYFHDVDLGSERRHALLAATTLAELAGALDEIAASGLALPDQPRPRGPSGGPRRVVLPEGWLEHSLDPSPPEEQVDAIGG
jgi:nifR3 family TIM-barrel protein